MPRAPFARSLLGFSLIATALAAPAARAAPPPFLEFESGPVRPLAMSPDGTHLFALDIPDGRLEIFSVGASGLTLAGEVQVGLEPVAVAARSNDEVWVVNHLSDSVSIVDVPSQHVTRTLLVGDEPRDVVFAGARAFITTAHRGQQRTDPSIAGVPGAGDPQLTTPGVGRADVWVFDSANLGATLGGTPVKIVTLFGDTPRGLAVSPDGKTVYVAIFHSGNTTTAIPAGAVCKGVGSTATCTVDGATLPGGPPGPATNVQGKAAPQVSVIVRQDPASGKWLDELGRDWSAAVRFTLPDQDVFALDAATLATKRAVAHVGTTLFNLAVNPVDGTLYVSNQDAQNQLRFEGPGTFAGHSLRGHLAEMRITVITPSQVLPRHLNKHIAYASASAPAGTADHSLSIPLDMAVTPDGATLYVAAYGSSKIGVLSTAELADDSFDPVADSAHYIPVTGGGPAGVTLDAANHKLYVLTRFDNAISVIDLATGAETAHLPLFNPEPASVVKGRPFLYDAAHTSSNGEAACASCHIFGDMDHLAWDLGNPDATVSTSPIEILLGIAAGGFSPPINGTGIPSDFSPMKGPMTVQTLRGLVNAGAEHWRGDRATGYYGTSAGDAALSFRNFVVAFDALLGRAQQISDADMDAFTAYVMQLTQPPNPVRNLDNTLSAAAQAGRDFYMGPGLADGQPGFGFTCNGCHTLDPASGQYGTGGKQSFENEAQIFKVPGLRNAYQKVGMFGMIQVPTNLAQDTSPQGPQIRGFGFTHDGSTDTLFRFFHGVVFRATANAGFIGGDTQRRAVEEFVLAFDSDLAPIVGQQVTLRADNAAAVGPRIDLMIARAKAPFVSKIFGGKVTECDLVVKGARGGRVRGYLMAADGTFTPDDGSAPLSDAELRALAATAGQELTYTAVPPGSGLRIGLDRDLDGMLDGSDHGPGGDDIPGGAASDGGCCQASGAAPTGSLLLALVAIGAVRRRRAGVKP
ncbi:MAG TPA: MYXO-CTERM sorting domain-containing protein [Kofleriaceae bacterium]|nr:MYXO-CTERM sorting domain-containing protein [Kofleriaceae bacterium]